METLAGKELMAQAICFKCSNTKTTAFSLCLHCKVLPQSNVEQCRSVILSDQMSTPERLAFFAGVIRRGQAPSFSPEELNRAAELVRSQFSGGSATASTAGSLPAKDAPPSSALHRNPFYVLGASTRDGRKRLVELAEEKALTGDSTLCAQARAEITNPKHRLTAELGWLPGVSPTRATTLVDGLRTHLAAVRKLSGTPALAQANLLASAFEFLDPGMSESEWADWIVHFAAAVTALGAESVLKLINEERAIAGFPLVASEEIVEEQLAQRRKDFRDAVRDALKRLSPGRRVKVVTMAAEQGTAHGTQHAPLLIDELIDSYEVDAQQFLIPERDNVTKLVSAARQAIPHGQDQVMAIVSRLSQVVRNWDAIAQPIQLSMKSRGLDHEMSHEIAREVRSLGITLHNEHQMYDATKTITQLLAEVFAEVPEVAEKVAEDVQAIERLNKDREESKRQTAEWEREITYRAELGLIFKDTLAISPNGLQWKETVYPLEKVTRVRWGAIRRSTNGIPTGTDYYITFGDATRVSTVETRKSDVFSAFTDRLWPAVCSRLITQMLVGLRQGKKYQFADAIVDDKGIELNRPRFMKSDERVYGTWDEVKVWTHDGSFCIGHKVHERATAALSYLETDNAHILETAMRTGFKKGVERLSDLLR
jgi:hypothetical protein